MIGKVINRVLRPLGLRLSRTNVSDCRDGKQDNLGFDQAHGMYYIADSTYPRRVYISDRKRSELYRKGVQSRLEWILRDYRIPLDIILPHDVVVDVGANAGELALHEKFAGCEYIAIEPDPHAFRALSLNHPNAKLVNCALSSARGKLDFYLATSEADSSLFKPASYTETMQVDVVTLDECMAQQSKVSAIKLLKIEAEGMEPEVLMGSTNTLKITKYVAVDAGPERGGESTAPYCLNFLFDRGFRLKDTYLPRGTFFLSNESLAW